MILSENDDDGDNAYNNMFAWKRTTYGLYKTKMFF